MQHAKATAVLLETSMREQAKEEELVDIPHTILNFHFDYLNPSLTNYSGRIRAFIKSFI